MADEDGHKPTGREVDSTRPIPREERQLHIESKKADAKDPTMDIDLDDVEILAGEEVTMGNVTGEVNRPPASIEGSTDGQDDEDDDLEAAALPGIGSKLKRLARSIGKKRA